MRGIKPIFTDAERIKDSAENGLSMAELARFFAPLAVTTLLMYITLSLFNAGLARLPSPELFISSYAIAQSFAFMVESFIIPIRQLMPAFINNRESYDKTKKFIMFLSIFVGLLFMLIIFSGLARWILENIMGVEGRILDEAVRILKVLTVFPVIVAFRNFFQGLLMKSRNTPLITAGAVVRMLFVATVILLIKAFSAIPGGIVAGALLLGAILVEALAMLAGIRMTAGKIDKIVGEIQENNSNAKKREVTNKSLLGFMFPLILTSFIGTVGTFVVNIGLIRTANPAVALTAFAVGWDLGMIFVSPLNMLHQVPVNYLQEYSQARLKSIKKFMAYLGIMLSLILAGVSFSPVGHFLLRHYMGVSEEISMWSMDVLKIMAILPAIAVVREFYWGLFLKEHKTKYIVWGKSINLISLGITVAVLTWIPPSNPAIIGAVGMLGSQVIELGYLFWLIRRKGLSQVSPPDSFTITEN